MPPATPAATTPLCDGCPRPGAPTENKRAPPDALALTGYERPAQSQEATDRPGPPLEPRLAEPTRACPAFAVGTGEPLEPMFTRTRDTKVPVRLGTATERSADALIRLIADTPRRGGTVTTDHARLTPATTAHTRTHTRTAHAAPRPSDPPTPSPG